MPRRDTIACLTGGFNTSALSFITAWTPAAVDRLLAFMDQAQRATDALDEPVTLRAPDRAVSLFSREHADWFDEAAAGSHPLFLDQLWAVAESDAFTLLADRHIPDLSDRLKTIDPDLVVDADRFHWDCDVARSPSMNRGDLLTAKLWYADAVEVDSLIGDLIATDPFLAAETLEHGVRVAGADPRPIRDLVSREQIQPLFESPHRVVREIAITVAPDLLGGARHRAGRR